jgi:hypothetical protein
MSETIGFFILARFITFGAFSASSRRAPAGGAAR